MSLHFYFYFSFFLVFFVFSSYHLLLIFPFSVDVSSCLFFLFPLSLLCTYSYTSFAQEKEPSKIEEKVFSLLVLVLREEFALLFSFHLNSTDLICSLVSSLCSSHFI